MAISDTMRDAIARRESGGGRRVQRPPVLSWLFGYRRDDLIGDLMAGVVVAIMLVPQSMAYAMLAGLPPQVGLYASIVPLIVYGALGTSHTLAVGPVAIVSLLVATAISPIAEPGSGPYMQLALTLALLVGLIQMAMGLLRLGFLVNFLSHPVLAGFTSAAAVIIDFSQVKHVLGLSVPRSSHFYETLLYLLRHVTESHLLTLSIGLVSIGILLYFRYRLGDQLRRWRFPEGAIMPLTKAAPLVVVVLGTLLVAALNLHEEHAVKIVGAVPAGLPPLTTPSLDLNTGRALLPAALTISFVGYLQSIAVAKALASKSRKKVGVNQELIALGAAQLGAAFTGGYPVTGGFSRSAVNFSSGANTPLASIITAGLIGLVVVLMTPVFYFLPTAVLAAIILVAVVGLIDLSAFKQMWRYDKADATSMAVTFVAVLALGVETGIIVGVIGAIVVWFWRTSRPHVAILGRWGEGESFRNAERHLVKTCPHIIAVRVDESLYFANASFFQDTLLRIVAEQPRVKHVVLDGTAINFIDASALETLKALVHQLSDAGVALYLSAIKGPVMDHLQKSGFVDKVGGERFFPNTHDAFKALGCV